MYWFRNALAVALDFIPKFYTVISLAKKVRRRSLKSFSVFSHYCLAFYGILSNFLLDLFVSIYWPKLCSSFAPFNGNNSRTNIKFICALIRSDLKFVMFLRLYIVDTSLGSSLIIFFHSTFVDQKLHPAKLWFWHAVPSWWVSFRHLTMAEAIRTTVVPIRILIRTTVVPIRILIRTTECDWRSV